MVMAKGIASGLPLSGILARKELMDRLPPGSHGGTYGGNVVSCAAANATLDVIEDEGLVANARERGASCWTGCAAACAGRASVGDVRGLGLMVAIEFVKPGEGDGRVPDPELTKRVQQEALRAQPARAHGRHVRQRDPDHPAPGDDGRRGRPGDRDPARGTGRRGRLSRRMQP